MKSTISLLLIFLYTVTERRKHTSKEFGATLSIPHDAQLLECWLMK
jgi:hypothetical protein